MGKGHYAMSEHSYIIGVDPGAGGSIVVLQSRTCPFPIEWIRMPTLKVGKATRVDCAALARFLQDFDTGTVYIEAVHAMPGNGSSAMFSFGHACGAVEGVCAALMMPYAMITPQRWKKHAGLIGTDKDASRSAAIQRWPKWADLAKKGAGQAFADAAFIAICGASTP